MTESEPLVSSWQEVGDPPPHELGPARAILREVGALVHAADPAGAGLEWIEEAQALASEVVPHERDPFRVAIRPAEAALELLDLQDSVLATCTLEGSSLDEARAWLGRRLEERGIEASLPEPDHREVIDSAHRPSLAELGRWISNADRVLRSIARHTEEASPVRFDPVTAELSTRIQLKARSGEVPRIVVVGLSCGDASVAEPYFFARPQPVDGQTQLPTLPNGARWVREPSVEAVMPCSSVASDLDPGAQSKRVAAFIEAALPAAHGLVQRAWARR